MTRNLWRRTGEKHQIHVYISIALSSCKKNLCHICSHEVAKISESAHEMIDNPMMQATSLPKEHYKVVIPAALTEEQCLVPASETVLMNKCRIIEAKLRKSNSRNKSVTCNFCSDESDPLKRNRSGKMGHMAKT